MPIGSIAAVSTEYPRAEPDAGRPLEQRLRTALLVALKARDRIAVTALRSTLAAIDNAQAVDPGTAAGGSAIEQTPLGVGATEALRRVLTQAEVVDIVRAEIAEREAAARAYEQANQPRRADLLRSEAGALSIHLAGMTRAGS